MAQPMNQGAVCWTAFDVIPGLFVGVLCFICCIALMVVLGRAIHGVLRWLSPLADQNLILVTLSTFFVRIADPADETVDLTAAFAHFPVERSGICRPIDAVMGSPEKWLMPSFRARVLFATRAAASVGLSAAWVFTPATARLFPPSILIPIASVRIFEFRLCAWDARCFWSHALLDRPFGLRVDIVVLVSC